MHLIFVLPFFGFIDVKTKKILEFEFEDTGLTSFELSRAYIK